MLLVALLSTAGCGGDEPRADGSEPSAGATTTTPTRPVLVLGDSLTVGAELWGGLEATLAQAGWRAEIVADDGRAVDWGLEQVRERDRVPDVVVVGLGTNPGGSAETFADDAATLVAELRARGATTVVWWPPGDVSDEDRVARAAALRSAAGGSLVVPDWPTELAAHPDWLARDDIHLTEDGYRGLTAFLRDELDRPGAAAVPPTNAPPTNAPPTTAPVA